VEYFLFETISTGGKDCLETNEGMSSTGFEKASTIGVGCPIYALFIHA